MAATAARQRMNPSPVTRTGQDRGEHHAAVPGLHRPGRARTSGALRRGGPAAPAVDGRPLDTGRAGGTSRLAGRPAGHVAGESRCRSRHRRRYPCGVRTTRDGASPGMIGRPRELRRLGQLALARRPEVAIVAGEPGIGKTRLVNELLDGLPPGTVTLVGHAEPGSLARPYEVLLDALYGRDDVDPERLDQLTDPARSPVE